MFKDQDKDKDFSSKDKDKDKNCIVKDKDQDKDCILVLMESLRTRTNITELRDWIQMIQMLSVTSLSTGVVW